ASTRWRRSFHLLPLEFIVERSFLNRHFILETLRINEWIWSAGLHLRELLIQVVHGWMRSERHIHVSRTQEFEALLILRDELRIAHEVRARIDAHAADDQDVIRLSAILHLHRPRRAD